MATTTKPSTFRRSSERKVTDPNETAVIRAERRRERERAAYESVGFSAGAAMVLVEPLEHDDKSDRLAVLMAAEDTSRVDLEGRIW